MANIKLFNEINNDVVKIHDNAIAKVIKKKQHDYEKTLYPDATSTTSMKCVICGGSYTKNGKSIHNKSKKHKNMVGLLTEYIHQK